VLSSLPAGHLAGIQFISPARGWAVGQDTVLATTDGGRHWTAQRTGPLNLTSVDFISGSTGWAVGADIVLATSDGGSHWAALPEPGRCLPIRSVHFISPRYGFAVAGGRDITDFGPEAPRTGGAVLATSDGGRSWRVLPGPADAQTVCFSGPQAGWLGAGGRLYRTTDGGRSWAQVTAGPQASVGGYPAVMIVQCAGGSAWALDVGLGATMSKQPNVGYHAGPAGAVPVFAEQYFPHPGVRVAADSPGAYPGPFSAISPSAAAFIGWCPACAGTATAPTAPWDLATGSGASLTPEGNVAGLTIPEAASFVSPRLGWVAGAGSYLGDGRFRQCILFTDDSGRTWHIQYASPAP
jgi:Photosynthesis system II assembly factor YCF48